MVLCCSGLGKFIPTVDEVRAQNSLLGLVILRTEPATLMEPWDSRVTPGAERRVASAGRRAWQCPHTHGPLSRSVSLWPLLLRWPPALRCNRQATTQMHPEQPDLGLAAVCTPQSSCGHGIPHGSAAETQLHNPKKELEALTLAGPLRSHGMGDPFPFTMQGWQL